MYATMKLFKQFLEGSKFLDPSNLWFPKTYK
jgi:hypothetical protein